MAQQDPHSRQQGGRGDHARRYDEESWYQGRDSDEHNAQWNRTQPRQGGGFEDRYSGRGGHESRGSESTQRGRWREHSYGQGRYENEDYLGAGGSYGGQYDDQDTSRFHAAYERPRGGYRRGQQQRGHEDRSGYATGPGTTRQSFRGKGPKGYERSDERLKELICERLTDDPNIDASEIDVEVRNCEVTLEGTVHDRRMKYEVEELIDQYSGVKEIRNNLRVRARGSESGSERSDAFSPSSSEASYGTSGQSGMTSGTTTGAGAGTQSRKNS